jgi:hypothetical protein
MEMILMFAFALIVRLSALLVLVTFGRPRTAGRHTAPRHADSDGFDLTTASGALIEASAIPRERLVYLTIDGDHGTALAGFRAAEARQLAAALLHQAALAA